MIRSSAIAGLAALVLLTSSCGGSDEAADPETTADAPITDDETTSTATPSDEDGGAADEEQVEEQTASNDASTFFPDVLAAEATRADDGTWTFAVTLSSPYDSPDQYADAWRVVAADGTELGFRLLTHDHASEQPFTRSESGIEIPDGITSVTIEGRDQANGWGGAFLQFDLPA